MRKWYEREECNINIMVCSQIYLFRNIKGYPFSSHLNEIQQKEIYEKIAAGKKIFEQNMGMKFQIFRLSELSELERRALLARLALPAGMLDCHIYAGLCISEDESVSILINGCEHICIQISYPGKDIHHAYQLGKQVDQVLNEIVSYAFDQRFGYLCSDLHYAGLGMMTTGILHIPFLHYRKKMEKLTNVIGKEGFHFEPFVMNKTKAPAELYRLWNYKMYGLSEEKLLYQFECLAETIAHAEYELQKKDMNTNKLYMEDCLYRAYGLMKYAKSIGYEEAMRYLSVLRTGDLCHLWQSNCKKMQFQLLLQCHPALLDQMNQENEDCLTDDMQRAEKIKSYLWALED